MEETKLTDEGTPLTISQLAEKHRVPFEAIVSKCRLEAFGGVYGPGSPASEEVTRQVLAWIQHEGDLSTADPHEQTLRRIHRWLLAEAHGCCISPVGDKPGLERFVHDVQVIDSAGAGDVLNQRREMFRCARRHVGNLLNAYAYFPQWALTLPPCALNMLNRGVLCVPRTFRNALKAAYSGAGVNGEDASETSLPTVAGSPVSLAAIVASVILHGTGDARRVVRLAYSLFKTAKFWHSSAPWRATSGRQPLESAPG